ncbi:Tyrosine/DOPA decarboxylase 1 [Acorus gramineus]|uniref:Tyrosine/DOPA decarboxylase 1 n=1 Tax=Acorus gramineus TaxID=55184 RepID=A0AAV9BY07_ACOGR|nr:Tyrosine/DOPA decarboxylase 1 [Acorus gramineus]
MAAFIADYYKDIETYPVRSQVEPGYLHRLLPDSAPHFPEPLTTILDDVRNDILPGLTHWQSPNFFAYFQANASNPGILDEMLCAALNVVGFNWISSPAATELETLVMDWMAKFLRLPREFTFASGGGGVIHGSTCEAVVCTMAAARDAASARIGFEGITRLVIYASDQTHFTFQKASKLVGIPPANFRMITTSARSEHALPPESVHAAMDEDLARGLVPLYICATVGTTAVGAVDPLAPLGELAREYGTWARHNLMDHIRSDVEMAEQFERMVGTDEKFEVVATRRFALVCFRLRPKKRGSCEMNRKLLEAVNASGRAFMTQAVVEGKYVLRMAIGATLTEERHVLEAWKVIQEMADGIISEEDQ